MVATGATAAQSSIPRDHQPTKQASTACENLKSPESDPRLRVLLADDHPIVRRVLADLLNAQADMRVVGEACDGCEALRQAVALRPDVVIMDISMPRMNGLEATGRLRSDFPATLVIVLTMSDGREAINRAMAAGARGFLRKDHAAEQLVPLIRQHASVRVQRNANPQGCYCPNTILASRGN